MVHHARSRVGWCAVSFLTSAEAKMRQAGTTSGAGRAHLAVFDVMSLYAQCTCCWKRNMEDIVIVNFKVRPAMQCLWVGLSATQVHNLSVRKTY